MTKFINIFLWVISLILVWSISKHLQVSHLNATSDYVIIISAFLLIISPPIYWIFTFSEKPNSKIEKKEETKFPQAEIFIDDIISQQNMESLSPSVREKSENEIAKIFTKVEKIAASNEGREELQSIKKQIQIKILCLLNERLFAIEKLQEEALMMIEMSESLRDSEKLLMCHHIKLYITEKKKDLIE